MRSAGWGFRRRPEIWQSSVAPETVSLSGVRGLDDEQVCGPTTADGEREVLRRGAGHLGVEPGLHRLRADGCPSAAGNRRAGRLQRAVGACWNSERCAGARRLCSTRTAPVDGSGRGGRGRAAAVTAGALLRRAGAAAESSVFFMGMATTSFGLRSAPRGRRGRSVRQLRRATAMPAVSAPASGPDGRRRSLDVTELVAGLQETSHRRRGRPCTAFTRPPGSPSGSRPATASCTPAAAGRESARRSPARPPRRPS